jgi:hypothetical protein
MLKLKAFPLLHELHTKSYRIWSQVKLGSGELQARFKLEAAHPKEFAKVILAEPNSKPARRPELWKQTCFEIFIPSKNSDAYLEFNGSTSGDWNWYSFRRYREGMTEFSLNAESMPRQRVQSRSDSSLDCEWVLPITGIRQGFLSAGMSALEFDRVGITAVLATSVATTYWAISHEGIKPDFHLRNSWTQELTGSVG